MLNKHKKQQGTIFLEDKGFISDPHTVANKFNDFFLNVAGKLCEKIEKKNSKYQDYLKNPNESSFFLKETEPGDFVKIINKLQCRTNYIGIFSLKTEKSHFTLLQNVLYFCQF